MMPNVAVVTGGAGGMGVAVARLLGRDAAVLISGVNPERLDVAERDLRKTGVDCMSTICDVTDRDSVRKLVDHARTLGTVTSVVHTAGVSPSMGSAELILGINAVGTVHITEAFLKVAGPGMALVNVASVAGHQLPAFLAPTKRYRRAFTDTQRLQSELLTLCNCVPAARRPQLAYVLSKNFVIWYSRLMAAQYGSANARVVSVSPGPFDTAMGKLEASSGAALTQIGALKRFGHPTEIAELVAFCASDKPAYLTGADIICDGGAMAAMSFSNMLKLRRLQ